VIAGRSVTTDGNPAVYLNVQRCWAGFAVLAEAENYDVLRR
jgi:hypothetical protein